MNRHYRRWEIIVTLIFIALSLPIIFANTFLILFSRMGTESHWGSDLVLGLPVILALLIVFISIRGIFFADFGLFLKMELVLVLMIANLIILFALNNAYSLLALCYGLTGILQIRKFWKFASPTITERHLRPAMIVITMATLVSFGTLSYGLAMSVPKLPPDKKGIKFYKESLQFHDDWKRKILLGKLAEDQEIQGILFPKDTFLYFYESGELEIASLGEKGLRIHGINCAGNENVHFYKSGQLQSAKLSEDQMIEGKMYLKGEYLNFNEDGSIRRK